MFLRAGKTRVFEQNIYLQFSIKPENRDSRAGSPCYVKAIAVFRLKMIA